MSDIITSMNAEGTSKSVYNNNKSSLNKFSKKVKPLEVRVKKLENLNLSSIDKKLSSNKN
jgi:hypothetical protein